MGLFKGAFRTTSQRISDYDYSQSGYYFVTICTKARKEWFGTIENEILLPTNIGTIVERLWKDIPNHFPNAELDEYVVMPNHVHGIIVINNPNPCRDVAMQRLYVGIHQYQSSISPKPGSLSTIIRSYKSACSNEIHITNPDFSWQPNYYEHIIRNESSLNRIREYIQTNPLKWGLDIEHPGCAKRDATYYKKIFDDVPM